MVASSMPLIWKAPSPTSTSGRSFGCRRLHAERGRHGEAERAVVGRPEEMGAVVDVEILGAEERVARVGDDDHVVLEERVDLAEQRRHRHRFVGGGVGAGMHGMLPGIQHAALARTARQGRG